MRFDVLTAHPHMFDGPFDEGVVGRAAEQGLVELHVHDLRDYSTDRHRNIDDEAYGGGPGMVLKPEPIFAACEALCADGPRPEVVLLCPAGERLTQDLAARLAQAQRIVLIAGRYEGIDERVRSELATHVVSIGDFVLTGGEIPAMAVVDAVARLVPGVVGNAESLKAESFSDGLLDHPHYTRPPEFRGLKVPDVLLSGDHERIRLWRRREALRRTLAVRPEMLEPRVLSDEDRALAKELRGESSKKAVGSTQKKTCVGGQHA